MEPGQETPRGLVGWLTERDTETVPAPVLEAESAGVVEEGVRGGRLSVMRRFRWWILAGVGALVVAVPAVLVPLLSGPDLTPVGATVHTQHTGDYKYRSADIRVNSLQVSDDASLCTSARPAPTRGFWLIVDLTVTNTGADEFPISNGSFDIVDADGNDIDLNGEINNCSRDSSRGLPRYVAPGERGRFRLAFDVPATEGVITYDPEIAEHTISWAFPG